ncbi:MAG: DUF2723 domain-containing protein [Thermotogae bacterium]|nr:DUF2723 domain-containing protein [Thermotogota bacterium]
MINGRLKWYLALAVFLFVSFIYFKTTAPTTAFWDVGEFLAAAHILGVPHPPGTPFYVLLAKFFELLPIPVDKLYSLINDGVLANPNVLRMTLIPILMGGANAALVYLIAHDLMEYLNSEQGKEGQRDKRKSEDRKDQHDQQNQRKLHSLLLHVVALTGALLPAFAMRIWFNSIEVETYTPGAFFGILALYFGMLWYKNRDKVEAYRWIYLAVLSIMLGTGVHLTVLFALPALMLLVWTAKPKDLWDRYALGLFGALFALFALLLVTYDGSGKLIFILGLFLMLVYMLKDGHLKSWNQPLSLTFLVGLALALLGSFNAKGEVAGFSGKQLVTVGAFLSVVAMFIAGRMWNDWKGWVFLIILFGFTVEFWIFVRANYLHMHPLDARINEGDPYTWQAFMDVLLRKQYEPAHMFPRRIPLSEQIQVFLMWFGWQWNAATYAVTDLQKVAQFSLIDHLGPLGLAVAVLGLLGLWEQWDDHKRRPLFWLVGGATLLAGIGFFLAFNFKDSPTHPVNPINLQLGNVEVRNRDYFYHPFYQLWGVYIALGLFFIARRLKDYIKDGRILAGLFAILGAMMVAFQIKQHWFWNDRSRNYIPEDFARNILTSAKAEKGVFMTNGDNDTFPVWFVQEVLGIKWPLINANLSLLNTNWYVRELKYWGAPISFPDSVIYNLPEVIHGAGDRGLMFRRDVVIRDMIATSVGYKPAPEDYVEIPGLKGMVKLPRIYLAPKSLFAKEVFEGREFKVPIYFSITDDPDVYRGWESYMVLEGMLMRLTGEIQEGPNILGVVDVAWTDSLLTGGAEDPVRYVKEQSLAYDREPSDRFWSYRALFDDRQYKNHDHLSPYRNYATVALTVAATYTAQGNHDRAVKFYDLAKLFIEEFLRLQGKDPKTDPQLFALELSRAYVFVLKGDYDKALKVLNTYKTFLPTHEGEWREAVVYLHMGDTLKAREKALSLLNEIPQPDPIWGQDLEDVYALLSPEDLTDVTHLLFINRRIDLALKLLDRTAMPDKVKVWVGQLMRAVQLQDPDAFALLGEEAPFDTTGAGEWKMELEKLYGELERIYLQKGDTINAERMRKLKEEFSPSQPSEAKISLPPIR